MRGIVRWFDPTRLDPEIDPFEIGDLSRFLGFWETEGEILEKGEIIVIVSEKPFGEKLTKGRWITTIIPKKCIESITPVVPIKKEENGG